MAFIASNEQGISVLYVEDNLQAREIVLSVLQARYPGVCFRAAENGSTGLSCFHECQPQIVITDICMPVMGGIEMAASIKDLAPDTILIATSAYSEAGYFIRAIEIGFNHFVLKPLDYDQLFVALDRSIEYVTLSRRVRSQQEHIVKLSRALEQSVNAVVITDTHGTIDYVNHKYSESTGYAPHEVLGKNIRFLRTDLTPDSVYEELWNTISAGHEWRGELHNRRRDGGLYWENASISPLKDADGVVTHYVAVKEDITERKRAEEEIRELNAALVAKAQKLETANLDLEAFNSTVSHDLRNHIYAIGGFAQVLLKKECSGGNDECRQYLEVIVRQSENMERLIDTLLKFSRISFQEVKRKPVDLSSMALELSLQLRMWHPERKALFVIGEELGCSGDYGLLRIALENLLGNAWKYSARKAEAVIEFNAMSQNGRTVYFVRDNGVGFDSAHSSQLFKTFSRLHPDSDFEGFGIGLATVQRVIEKHGGKVWAEGIPGEGATFFFTLEEGDN